MLSGSRAVTALGNLVLSHRDSLLFDAQSTVPADEVGRLCYADLSSFPEIFPTPLLDSALNKMRAASNNALVQQTLHPQKIPRKSSAGPSKAGSSSASPADRGGVSSVVPRSQQQASTAPSSSSTQQGRKKRGRTGKAPFSGPPAAPSAPVANENGPGKSPPRGLASVACGGTGRRLGQIPGCSLSCGTDIASPSWTLLLPSLAPRYRF